MNKGVLAIIIGGGLLFLVGLGAMIWGTLDAFFTPAIIGLLLVGVVLFVIGADDKGKDKWRDFSFASAMLLGFSVLDIFGLGGLLAPVAAILLAFFTWKWASSPQNKPLT